MEKFPKKIKIVRFLIVCFIAGSMLFINSCEDLLTFEVDCNDCYFPEPDSADIIMYFTIDDRVDFVPYVVYKGKADARNIEYVDTAYSETNYLYVKTGEFYSVEATYSLEDKTVIAGDGDKLRTRHITDVCSEDCYVIRGGIMNVRLK